MCEIAFLVLAIWWGVTSDPPRDFDGMTSGWRGVAFVTITIGASACAVWLFYTRGPAVLLDRDAVWGTIATLLLVAAIFAVKYLVIAVNMIGVQPTAERINGKFADIRSLSRGQNRLHRLCDVELENGITVVVQCEVLHDGKYAFGGTVPVLFYRGNLFYWGKVVGPAQRD